MKIDTCTMEQIAINNKGYSTLSMVLMILFLTILLINSLSKSSLSWQKNVIYHKVYYQHFNAAISSIEWAMTQPWQRPTQEWQCQSLLTHHLTACIKQSAISTGNYVLLKGQSSKIKLYHFATFQLQTGNLGQLTLERGHWLDYCPESQGEYCD